MANQERVRHWRTVAWFGMLKRNQSVQVLRPPQWPSRLSKPLQKCVPAFWGMRVTIDPVSGWNL